MLVQIKGVSQSSAKFLSRTSIGAASVSDSWYAKLDTTTTDVGNGIAVDSSGNVYIVGTSASTDVIVIKYNNTGSLVWQRKLSGASSTETGNGIAVDNLGNVYIVGTINNGVTDDILIAKYNTSGTLLWQTILASSGTDVGKGIAVDSSGNVYIAGSPIVTGTDIMVIAKFDTNGNTLWQKYVSSSQGLTAKGIAVDSSGNVYITGAPNTGDNAILKYDTNGNQIWQRRMTSNQGNAITVDSSGNVYITGYDGDMNNGLTVTKILSSGSLAWKRVFNLNPYGFRSSVGYGIAVDSSGNVYITGSLSNDISILKYDPNGTLLWQTKLASTGTDAGNGIAVDSSGTNVYITGSIDSDLLIARLPANGSIVNPTYTGKIKLVHSTTSLSSSPAETGNYSISPGYSSGTYTLDSFKCDLYSSDPALTSAIVVASAVPVSSTSSLTSTSTDMTQPVSIQTLASSGTDVGKGIAVDSSGNVYITGSTGTDIIIAKYNSSRTIEWQRTLASSGTDVGYGIAVDSSGTNVYITGSIGSDAIIAKYNTSGTLLWQTILASSGTDVGKGIALDSSGNVYIAGSTSTGTDIMVIAKFDTSGTIQWQRTLTDTLTDISGTGIAVDGSGNVYATGDSLISGSQGFVIVKYDTSGTLLWQTSLATSGTDVGKGIAVDSSGNAYVSGNAYSNYAYNLTAKYNSNGNIQWQRKNGPGLAANAYGSGIAVDSSGNVYITGYIYISGGTDIIILKYNTSVEVVYGLKISNSGQNQLYGNGIAVDSSGNAYITGSTGTDIIITKIPINGVAVGTYGSVTLSSYNYNSVSTLTSASTSFSGSARTLIPNKVWISTFGASGSSLESGNGIALDSAKNIYTIGKTLHTSGTTDSLLVKYDNSGTMQWQRTLTGSNSNDSGNGIAIDSSSNIYTVGTTGSNANDIVISKYNTSGVIQWQAILGTSTAQLGNGIAVDSSGNVYITGKTGTAILTAKYNTLGAIQWQRTIAGANDSGNGIAVDSSNNVYITGSTKTDTDNIITAKYNSSGTLLWQRKLGSDNNQEYGLGIAVDSSGNAYITGYYVISGYKILLTAKYDTSGTIQWQRRIYFSNIDVYGQGIAVDSSGNVYITGSTGTDIIIAKYNTSGTIQWQRNLTGASTNDIGLAIKVDGDYVYISGSTSTGAKSLIAKLANDGSYTGTYGSFTYATSILTADTVSLDEASISLTQATTTLTSSLILNSTELNASSVNNYLR